MAFVKKINGQYTLCWRNITQTSYKGRRGKSKVGESRKKDLIRTGALVKYGSTENIGRLVCFQSMSGITFPKELIGKRIKLVVVELNPEEKMITRMGVDNIEK